MEADEVRHAHSGPTPRGRGDSAAEVEEKRVLRSSNASILLMVAVESVAMGREVVLELRLCDAGQVNMPAVITRGFPDPYIS